LHILKPSLINYIISLLSKIGFRLSRKVETPGSSMVEERPTTKIHSRSLYYEVYHKFVQPDASGHTPDLLFKAGQ
jgi:hypothetical protein